jgi:hypothetical protein
MGIIRLPLNQINLPARDQGDHDVLSPQAQRWPPGGTRPNRPRDFRKFMGWIFLATSVEHVRVSIGSLPGALRQPGPVPPIRLLLVAPVFSVAVSIICALAWWTVWKRKSSGRSWAVAASMICVLAFARQFVVRLPPAWDWRVSWLWIGIVGLVAFSWPNRNQRKSRTTA